MYSEVAVFEVCMEKVLVICSLNVNQWNTPYVTENQLLGFLENCFLLEFRLIWNICNWIAVKF